MTSSQSVDAEIPPCSRPSANALLRLLNGLVGYSGASALEPDVGDEAGVCPLDRINVLYSAASKRLFVDPIDPVDLALDRVGDRDHRAIVVEDPADLGAGDAVIPVSGAADIFDHHEGQLAGHA